MCPLNNQFYYINRNIQLSLFTLCFGDCSSIESISWNIYQGSINWTLFTPMTTSWFYGKFCSSFDYERKRDFFLGFNTKNLTITKDFFSENNQTIYWRFEVIYSFQSEISRQVFEIEINEEPKNGFCSINPSNGTMFTLFTINCSNWFDRDEIKDFTFYGLTYLLSHKIDFCIFEQVR